MKVDVDTNLIQGLKLNRQANKLVHVVLEWKKIQYHDHTKQSFDGYTENAIWVNIRFQYASPPVNHMYVKVIFHLVHLMSCTSCPP